jgi:hypothetical protein
VIVAVFAVRVMQVVIHQIVDMVAMGDAFVTAVRSMSVARIVFTTVMLRRAAVLIHSACRQGVFVDVVFMDVVQVTIVEIVRMAIVPNSSMATVRAVDVCMPFMFGAGSRHLRTSEAMMRRSRRYVNTSGKKLGAEGSSRGTNGHNPEVNGSDATQSLLITPAVPRMIIQ